MDFIRISVEKGIYAGLDRGLFGPLSGKVPGSSKEKLNCVMPYLVDDLLAFMDAGLGVDFSDRQICHKNVSISPERYSDFEKIYRYFHPPFLGPNQREVQFVLNLSMLLWYHNIRQSGRLPTPQNLHDWPELAVNPIMARVAVEVEV